MINTRRDMIFWHQHWHLMWRRSATTYLDFHGLTRGLWDLWMDGSKDQTGGPLEVQKGSRRIPQTFP